MLLVELGEDSDASNPLLPACTLLALEVVALFFAGVPEDLLLCAKATAPASKIIPRTETVVFIPKFSFTRFPSGGNLDAFSTRREVRPECLRK